MIQRIAEENPVILAAEAAVAAARARADAADQPLYNPKLSVDMENGQSTVTTAGINQTLDWSGKRANRQIVAMRELQAELAVTQRRVTAETLAALADYQTAREQVTLAEQRSRLMREFAETATRRLAAGDISRLDAALAQVALNEALMQQARAAATLSQFQPTAFICFYQVNGVIFLGPLDPEVAIGFNLSLTQMLNNSL